MKILQFFQRRHSPLLLAFLACFFFSVYLLQQRACQTPTRLWTNTDVSEAATLPAANATLGFGGIYVVSGPGSPRRRRLLEAAAVTELELTVPEQREWTEDDVLAFQIPDHENSKVGRGSIKAWLSHHLVLRDFLASGKETALIMEDDVDWDIRLRTRQVPIAQDAAQSLFRTSAPTSAQYPWGHPDDWDILYIGHCGDYFDMIERGVGVGHQHPEDLDRIAHVLAPDPTMPMRTDLHPYTASLLTAFAVPEQTRIFHRSKWPLCSFGYAVNRRSAQLILDKVAPATEFPVDTQTAYDAAILTGCRDGPLVCYALQPELFHHMEGASLIDVQYDHSVERPPVDAAGLDQVLYRGETSNINCGFWSGDFYPSGDQKKLQHLVSEVGRKGQCLKSLTRPYIVKPTQTG